MSIFRNQRTPKPKDYFIALKTLMFIFLAVVEFYKGVFIVKGVNEHIENFNSEPCGRHFGHLLFSKKRETGDQFGRAIQPKYGVFTYTQIWLKKVPYAEVEIFSGICGIRAAL